MCKGKKERNMKTIYLEVCSYDYYDDTITFSKSNIVSTYRCDCVIYAIHDRDSMIAALLGVAQSIQDGKITNEHLNAKDLRSYAQIISNKTIDLWGNVSTNLTVAVNTKLSNIMFPNSMSYNESEELNVLGDFSNLFKEPKAFIEEFKNKALMFMLELKGDVLEQYKVKLVEEFGVIDNLDEFIHSTRIAKIKDEIKELKGDVESYLNRINELEENIKCLKGKTK